MVGQLLSSEICGALFFNRHTPGTVVVHVGLKDNICRDKDIVRQ